MVDGPRTPGAEALDDGTGALDRGGHAVGRDCTGLWAASWESFPADIGEAGHTAPGRISEDGVDGDGGR